MLELINKFLRFTSSRYFFVPFVTLLAGDLHFTYSRPILASSSVIISLGANRRMDIAVRYPDIWHAFKIAYMVVSVVGIAIIAGLLYQNVFARLIRYGRSDEVFESKPLPYPFDEDRLQMIVGLKHERLSVDKVARPAWVIVDEKGMYQNFLVTGTIGTGKTASAMYPFTKQAMPYSTRITGSACLRLHKPKGGLTVRMLLQE